MKAAFTIQYSEKIPDVLQETPEQFEAEAKMAMAVKLFEMRRLSSGMAASLVGVDRTTFLMSLSKYHVNMIDIDNKELDSDIENA